MSRGMAASSLPLALSTVRVGASATAFTVTSMLAMDVTESAFDASVLVTKLQLPGKKPVVAESR